MLGVIILSASIPTLIAGPLQAQGMPAGPTGAEPRFAFEVRDIQVEGLDWRGVLKGRARRLDWQAGVIVWAIGEETARDLSNYVQKSARSSLIQAPIALAEAGQSARTMTGSTVQLVVDLERRAEGPGGPEGALAYQPVLQQMHNGVDLAVSATPSDEGLVVGINLDETSLQGIHTGSFEDSIDGQAATDDRPLLGLFRRRGEGDDPAVSRAGAMKLQASFQVPEIARSHVEGAWPLKPGESLLISLGARSTSEKWGRSAVMERLVLVTARPESEASTTAGAPPAPLAPIASPGATPGARPAAGNPFPPTPSPTPFPGGSPR